MLKQTLALAAVAAPLVIASAMAQQPAIKRTPLQTVDFPAGYNVVTAIAEVPAGSCAGRHTHPGVELSYVMEGPMVVKIEGKPDLTLKTGDFSKFPSTPCTMRAASEARDLRCSAPTLSKKASRSLRPHRNICGTHDGNPPSETFRSAQVMVRDGQGASLCPCSLLPSPPCAAAPTRTAAAKRPAQVRSLAR